MTIFRRTEQKPGIRVILVVLVIGLGVFVGSVFMLARPDSDESLSQSLPSYTGYQDEPVQAGEGRQLEQHSGVRPRATTGSEQVESAEPEDQGKADSYSETTTLDILQAMTEAYLAGDNVALDQLRGEALKRENLDLGVCKTFFRNLIWGTFKRHDGEPTLERAIGDVLVNLWAHDVLRERQTGFLDAVMVYATDLLEGNPFLEFDGHWKGQVTSPTSLAQQRQFYVRPARDMDTLGVFHVVHLALAAAPTVQPYDSPVALVSLFSELQDYVNDRLSHSQILTCELLVALRATRHLPELLKLSQDAKIDEVRGAAISAYLRLGGADEALAIAERWAQGVAARTGNVRPELHALASASRDVESTVHVTRIFFQLLEATDQSWDLYAQSIVDGYLPIRGTFVEQRQALFLALLNEYDPAVIATWAILLGHTHRETNDAAVLAWVRDRVLLVARGGMKLRDRFERERITTRLVWAYRDVLSELNKGECITLLEEAYGLALDEVHPAFDSAMLGLLGFGFGQHLAEYGVSYARALTLLEPATDRTLRARRMFREDRALYVKAWAALQGDQVYGRLDVLVNQYAEGSRENKFYFDALIAWQLEAHRRASGG